MHRWDTNCLDDCLLTQALSGLCVGLVLTDATGKVVWLNSAAASVLGSEIPACCGQPLTHLIHDLQLVTFWHEAAEHDGNHLADVAVQYPERLVLKVNATRYVDSEGKVLGRALLFCDVTSERRVQVELSEAVAKRLLDLTSGHMPPRAVAHLTQQELRILRMVGRGLGNEEIASQVGITASTVRSHLKNLYKKLGLNSRAEAVSYAVRNHLV